MRVRRMQQTQLDDQRRKMDHAMKDLQEYRREFARMQRDLTDVRALQRKCESTRGRWPIERVLQQSRGRRSSRLHRTSSPRWVCCAKATSRAPVLISHGVPLFVTVFRYSPRRGSVLTRCVRPYGCRRVVRAPEVRWSGVFGRTDVDVS